MHETLSRNAAYPPGPSTMSTECLCHITFQLPSDKVTASRLYLHRFACMCFGKVPIALHDGISLTGVTTPHGVATGIRFRRTICHLLCSASHCGEERRSEAIL